MAEESVNAHLHPVTSARKRGMLLQLSYAPLTLG